MNDINPQWLILATAFLTLLSSIINHSKLRTVEKTVNGQTALRVRASRRRGVAQGKAEAQQQAVRQTTNIREEDKDL